MIVSFRTDGREERSPPPEGFYTYVPEAFKAAAPMVEDSTEKRLAFLERIRAKEQAASLSPGVALSGDPLAAKTASSGSGSNMVRASMTPHGKDAGGGVWDYLFPDEPQRCISSNVGTRAETSKGKGGMGGIAGERGKGM